MNTRDLETVRQIVGAATNLDLSYAYEDLVFPENTAFIIQFDDTNPDKLFCYFHKDCDLESRGKILSSLKKECVSRNCEMQCKGDFTFEEKNQKIQLSFF